MIDTLRPLVDALEQLSGKRYADAPRPFRIVADHLRSATFAIADGAKPSNVEAGYIARRLIRRAIRYGRELGIQQHFCAGFSEAVLSIFTDAYPILGQNRHMIVEEMEREETRFKATLERGLREYRKVADHRHHAGGTLIPGEETFNLYETFGFPLALTVELAREEGLQVDEARFGVLSTEHRELSQHGTEQKFKGGLADHAELTTRLHTATHLLHAAFRQVLGESVHQMGSNITAERLRFDFSYLSKLTDEQLQRVQQIVNEQIERDSPVSCKTMPLDQALALGALAFFGEKYGAQVKVYTIDAFSKEVCGGPHVAHTGELGGFRILKQEAVGRGVRRIRAVLAPPISD
jgi:alanyl-tRNA synthetase